QGPAAQERSLAASGARLRRGLGAPPCEHGWVRRASTLLAVFYVLLWASAYVPSKVAATAAPPLWFLVARFLVAGLLMGAIAVANRARFGGWLVYATLGVLANA